MLSASSMPNQALLVIDMQIGQFSVEPFPFQHQLLLTNINRLIEHFHLQEQPVFFIRHAGPAGSPYAAGEAIWNLVPELKRDEEKDVIVDKVRASCFEGTPLTELLHQQQIGEVVIVRLKTQYCVDTACRSAALSGFKSILISDGHSCIDTPQLSAEQIINHHNACLHGPISRVMSTDIFIDNKNT